VGGGGTRQRSGAFKRAGVSSKTSTRTTFYNVTLGGHRINNNYLVIYQPPPCALAHTHSSLTLGSITYIPNNSQPNNCTWDSLFSGLPPPRPSGIGEGTQFKLGKCVISRSSDMCSEGSWVFYDTHNVRSIAATHCPRTNAHRFPQTESPSKAARVYKIVTSKDDTATSFVVLEPWNVSARRDERYGMPILHCDRQDVHFAVSPEVRSAHCSVS